MWRVWVTGEAYTEFWWGNLRESDHLGEQGADVRTILRQLFRKWDMCVWTGSICLGIGNACECGNEPSGSIKCEELLD